MILAFVTTLTVLAPDAPDAPNLCQHVRLADLGWTDVACTTAVAANLLRREGYTVDVENLSLPVTLMGLKNNDIDVFLGNWMPMQKPVVTPYFADNGVMVASTNLHGARFGLAVPHYVYQAGISSLADLAAHGDAFEWTIYGIESGAAGNEAILRMLKSHAYGLSTKWHVADSSEQAMLAEVKQKVGQHAWVVFLAWEPHPMNTAMALDYLDDPQHAFSGSATGAWVQTLVRHDLAQQCPQLQRFLGQLTFTIDMENAMMSAVVDHGQTPADAANAYIASHPADTERWLRGLKKISGASDAETDRSPAWRLPLGVWCEAAVRFVQRHFAGVLHELSTALSARLRVMVTLLAVIPVSVSIVGAMALIWILHRRISLAVGVGLALLLIWNLGFWHAMCETLVLVMASTALAVGVGVPVGIAAAHRRWLYSALRPLLDFMQTIPTFVYLIPTLMLFGLGAMPGLVSTVIFVIPIPIRMTYFGIRNIPKELREASEAFGANPWQRLIKVEIPSARAAIMQGVNQALMLALSMVVIASLVGAEGLGSPVIRALNTVNVGLGFEAGIAIVAVAMILDRAVRIKS